MNQTLKKFLSKLKLETGGDWVSLLPFALLRARCTPYVKSFTPYEIMFGQPPPLVPRVGKEQLQHIKILMSLSLYRHSKLCEDTSMALSGNTEPMILLALPGVPSQLREN